MEYLAGLSPWDWFVLVEYELLLFAAVFFLIGALDELAVDILYVWLRLTGRIATPRLAEEESLSAPLSGKAAVLIPTWQEARVIGATVSYALNAWPHRELTIYVGCYRNDPETIAAVAAIAEKNARLELVVVPRDGPTCKAHCLNHLYDALRRDEAKSGEPVRMVVLHDAEDMVDPAALALMDRALERAEFVQLPVLALPQRGSALIAGHYCDEFAEAHGRTMPVRDVLQAGIPGAGVGCAIARPMLDLLARDNALAGEKARPFATNSLTEDYELGLRISSFGGRATFLRVRHASGSLVATRSYFPDRLDQSVRQKTRWTHGIALQSWDRLGWHGGPVKLWMQLRDRRGPLAALLLAIAYLLVAMHAAGWVAERTGIGDTAAFSPFLAALLWFNFAFFVWRAIMRCIFTTREFGRVEGLRAIARIPISNIIAIMAGRRAVIGYLKSLGGEAPRWDKTEHLAHPMMTRQGV